MSGNTCDVCRERPTLGVASSACGPISFAYCAECAAAGAEPYGMVVLTTAMCGDKSEDCNAAWLAVVRVNLAYHKKTEDEFWAAVRIEHAEMMKEMSTP